MKWFNWILLPFSLVFLLITTLRNLLYDLGLLKERKVNAPIIGIGNITVGGTGKTPHSQFIAKILTKTNKVAILSKGYGRISKGFKYVNIDSKSEEVGDEPLQMKQNFPKEIVAVDDKRVNGILKIQKDYPKIDAFVLDDAYQHRSIKIGFNILLCDYNNPIYRDWILPVGLLRESRKGIKRADCIIVTKCPNDLTKEKAEEIKKYLNFKGQVFFSKMSYDGVIPLNKMEKLDKSVLKNIILVTGIANSKPIINYLNNLKIKNTHLKFKDHYKYKKNDVNKILKNFEKDSRNQIILTTEKDAQKLKEFKELLNIPVYYLKVSVDFLWNKDKFEEKIVDYAKSYS